MPILKARAGDEAKDEGGSETPQRGLFVSDPAGIYSVAKRDAANYFCW